MKIAFTIGRLARATGVNNETIRYYERAGLIDPPARTEGNYRAYRDADIARLRFIKRTRDLGFSLEQVRALLSISGQRERDCGTVDAIAIEHLAEIDRKIADLTALRRELAEAVASCTGGTVAECRILEVFSPEPEAMSRQVEPPDGQGTASIQRSRAVDPPRLDRKTL